MKNWMLPISIVGNLFLLGLFSFNNKSGEKDIKPDCACCGYDTVYAYGGYYIFKDKSYAQAESMIDFAGQVAKTKSKPISHSKAAEMVKNLSNLNKIFLTNYIDFNYKDILSITEAMKKGGIPEEKQGIRVYYGAYTDGLLEGRNSKIKAHYSAIILGTNDGVDLYDENDEKKFPIINYGNLCPPVCEGDDITPGINQPTTKARLFQEAQVIRSKNIKAKKILKQ